MLLTGAATLRAVVPKTGDGPRDGVVFQHRSWGAIVVDHTRACPQIPGQARGAPVAGSPDPAQRRTGPRAGWRRVWPRLTSAELIAAGVSAELLASLALRRASSGRVAKSGDHYFDHGHPMPSYLTQTLDELTDSGLLILTEDVSGMRRLGLTEGGRTRHAQLRATPQSRIRRGAAGPAPQPYTLGEDLS